MNMTKKSTENIIPDEVLINKIYLLRNQKIMLDKDLAELYGVRAIRLREQVKRNIGRFPVKFMFQLNENEVNSMVSQKAIPSKQSLGGSLPFAFTEHGILMLANVLKTEAAIKMSIKIIEIFIKIREMVLSHKELLLKVSQLDKIVGSHDESITQLFEYLKLLIRQEDEPRKRIGFNANL